MLTIHTNSCYGDIRISDKIENQINESIWDNIVHPNYIFDISDSCIELISSTVRLGESHRIVKVDLYEEFDNISNFDKFKITLPSRTVQIVDTDTNIKYLEYDLGTHECMIYILHNSLENFTHVVLARGENVLP